MAGIYVHIPFCKKRCLYCDFFSTTLLERREEYVEALLCEITARRKEVKEPVKTIYIGGGTPSTLTAEDIGHIIETIGAKEAEEITMEINPGDATPDYLRALRAAGVNRLSIGIQSFQDHLLKLIGRRHTAVQAIEAVHWAQEAGFDNISIDLMYALPMQTPQVWMRDLVVALHLGVQHISSYGLMYEEGTMLTKMRDNGLIKPVDEDTEIKMYDQLCKHLKNGGFVHYEVSNFALPGYESKHNSNYWNGTPYIGVGAGAHSYVGKIRSWNPDDVEAYIQGIKDDTLQRESETLTDTDLYNERIMLGLRTSRGVPRKDIKADIDHYLEAKVLEETEDGRIVARRKGIHILNVIIEDLMI